VTELQPGCRSLRTTLAIIVWNLAFMIWFVTLTLREVSMHSASGIMWDGAFALLFSVTTWIQLDRWTGPPRQPPDKQ